MGFGRSVGRIVRRSANAVVLAGSGVWVWSASGLTSWRSEFCGDANLVRVGVMVPVALGVPGGLRVVVVLICGVGIVRVGNWRCCVCDWCDRERWLVGRTIGCIAGIWSDVGRDAGAERSVARHGWTLVIDDGCCERQRCLLLKPRAEQRGEFHYLSSATG